MLNLKYLYKICIIPVFFWPAFSKAQAVYEGQVLDSDTEAPVQNVSVVLSKAKTGGSTNQQGYFSFYTPQPVADDILMFTCVGYKDYSMLAANYKRGMFILLQSSSKELKEVVVRHRKKTQKLAEFIRDDIENQMDLHAWLYPFISAKMYGKLFTTTKPDAVVSNIELGRWQPQSWYAQTSKTVKFKVHIMTVNSSTNAPDSILATKEVFLDDRSRKVTVKFDSTNVILPSKDFFVVIEWLPLPYNEYIAEGGFIRTEAVNGKRQSWQNGGFDRVVYLPVPVRYKRAVTTVSWRLVNGVWESFKSPGYAFALSATISY